MAVPVISKLTRGQRVLAVVAVVVLAMFVGTTATNARHGATGGDPRDNGLVKALGNLFGGTSEAAAADLTAACPPPTATPAPDAPATAPVATPSAAPRHQLAIEGSCVVTVARSDEDLRTVTVTATDAVRVHARAPHDTSELDADVDAGAALEVSVDGDGVAITITCATTPSCVVSLGKGD